MEDLEHRLRAETMESQGTQLPQSLMSVMFCPKAKVCLGSGCRARTCCSRCEEWIDD